MNNIKKLPRKKMKPEIFIYFCLHGHTPKDMHTHIHLCLFLYAHLNFYYTHAVGYDCKGGNDQTCWECQPNFGISDILRYS